MTKASLPVDDVKPCRISCTNTLGTNHGSTASVQQLLSIVNTISFEAVYNFEADWAGDSPLLYASYLLKMAILSFCLSLSLSLPLPTSQPNTSSPAVNPAVETNTPLEMVKKNVESRIQCRVCSKDVGIKSPFCVRSCFLVNGYLVWSARRNVFWEFHVSNLIPRCLSPAGSRLPEYAK